MGTELALDGSSSRADAQAAVSQTAVLELAVELTLVLG